jgi:hypothetical protein
MRADPKEFDLRNYGENPATAFIANTSNKAVLPKMNDHEKGFPIIESVGLRPNGVRGPSDRLNKKLIAMMFSPLSYNVDGLRGITGVSLSPIERLFARKKLSDEILTSIEAFLIGWRVVLGDPQILIFVCWSARDLRTRRVRVVGNHDRRVPR